MNPAILFRIAENLTNGNLADAKKQAKRVSFLNLQLGFLANRKIGLMDEKPNAQI